MKKCNEAVMMERLNARPENNKDLKLLDQMNMRKRSDTMIKKNDEFWTECSEIENYYLFCWYDVDLKIMIWTKFQSYKNWKKILEQSTYSNGAMIGQKFWFKNLLLLQWICTTKNKLNIVMILLTEKWWNITNETEYWTRSATEIWYENRDLWYWFARWSC